MPLLVFVLSHASSDIVFGGDVNFGRYRKGIYHASDSHRPLAALAGDLKNAFTIVNLETPVAQRIPRANPGFGDRYVFGAPYARLIMLRALGVDAVSLANNHAYDQGGSVLPFEAALVEKAGMQPFGAPGDGKPVCVPLAFGPCLIALTTLMNPPEAPEEWLDVPIVRPPQMEALLVPIIAAATAPPIVFLHWGEEYETAPSEDQRRLAHAMIDAGAVLVVGHHPHVLQGVERYKNGLIAYSLGNLLFDMSSDRTRHGALLRVSLDGRTLTRAVLIPTQIRQKPNRTRRLRGTEADATFAHMQTLSAALGTTLQRDGDVLRVVF